LLLGSHSFIKIANRYTKGIPINLDVNISMLIGCGIDSLILSKEAFEHKIIPQSTAIAAFWGITNFKA
jgi:hypothetical protein